MYKKETLNGIEYHFDGSIFASAAEYAASISNIVISDVIDDMLRHVTIDNIEYQNVPRSGAKNYGLTDAQFSELFLAQQAQDFFESEKAKAILIMNDHMLGTGEEEITDLQVMDVKAYIQSIDPYKGFKVGIARAKVPRPSIFNRYD